MSERMELYNFSANRGDEIRQGLPPIVGSEGGSAWLSGNGHVAIGSTPLPSHVSEGMYIGIDLQPDLRNAQVVLGTSKSGASTLRLVINHENVAGRLSVLLRDEDGRTLEVAAQGSPSVARRLIISARPRQNHVAIYEIQPWSLSPTTPLSEEVLVSESPGRFSFDEPLALGGWFVDGQHQGSYTGRLANVLLGDKYLHASRVAELAAATASDNPMALDYDDLGSPSYGLRARFLRDVGHLRRLVNQRPMSYENMDDASLLLYRWLFEGQSTPILVALARKLGIQLWLPGESDQDKRFREAVDQDRPILHVRGGFTGSHWTTLSEWRTEPISRFTDHSTSREAFVKLVRNKLGAGHFDEQQLKKWQRDLLGITAGILVEDENALAFQMRVILSEVLVAVSVGRLEAVAEAI